MLDTGSEFLALALVKICGLDYKPQAWDHKALMLNIVIRQFFFYSQILVASFC